MTLSQPRGYKTNKHVKVDINHCFIHYLDGCGPKISA